MRYLAVIMVLFAHAMLSQTAQKYADQIPSTSQPKKLTEKEVVDPEFGIILYNKMISALGGDSIRYNKSGYNLQGWQEDYYADGKVLHKGFYIDGLIKVFKNYYENGQVERNFVIHDPKRCSLETYYPDGKTRSQVHYYDGNPQKEYDFFPNGNPEFTEESDKDLSTLYKRNSYFENGQPSSLFELVEKKARKYQKKEFFENGKLKEEGFMLFRKDLGDYAKEGEWNLYNEKGDLVKKEKYVDGQVQ